MQVKLVTVPKFVVSIDGINPEMVNGEDLAIYIARVSSPKKEDQKLENTEKLLNYLIKNNHWSPFEHAYYTFKITTSRAIGTQLLRHRSFTFQEFSQRYSEVTKIEDIEFRKKAEKNRQSSTDPIATIFNYEDRDNLGVTTIDDSELSDELYETITEVKLTLEEINKCYKILLEQGVAKETARMILPLASETTLYMTGNLRSWIHFLKIRNDEHAQKEIQMIAQKIQNVLAKHNPNLANMLW